MNNPVMRRFEGYVWTGDFRVFDQDDVTAACVEGAIVIAKAKA